MAGATSAHHESPTTANATGGGRPGVRLAAALLVGAFLALLVYGLVARSGGGSLDSELARGRTPAAPQFTLPVLVRGDQRLLPAAARRALADDRLALRELRGMPVVLNFWASWCPPCRGEAPTLERGWRAAAPAGVVFLGLNMQDVRDDARAFVGDLRLSYPSVREPDNEIARRYGVTGLPETFFIDARGRVVGHVIGAISESQLRRGVAAARTGRPLGSRRGGDRRGTR